MVDLFKGAHKSPAFTAINLTGDSLTVADFSIGAWMVYGGQAGFPLDRYPEIPRWYAALAALPGWRKAVPPA